MDSFVDGKNPVCKENMVAGIVGAFLFSLAGAVAYFLLHLIGYVASISGLIGAVCAVKGYTVFAKKESKKGIIISTIISLLVIVLAWYFCLAYDVYDVYKIAFASGEIDFSLTFIESVRAASSFLEEPEIARAYYGNLALGLLFCLIGCGSYVINKMRNAAKTNAESPKTQNDAPADQPAESTPEELHIEH